MDDQVTERETKGPKLSLFGMVWSPGEQFEKIKERPVIWGPLFIVSILFAAALALTAYTADMSLLLGDVPEDQAEMVAGFAKISMVVTGFFTPVFTILISSAIYMLVAKIAGSDVKFKQLFSMNTFITIIGALGLILNGLIHAAVGGNPEVQFTSLGGMLNVEGATGGLLNGIEVFSIWATVLTAIGLQKVAHFSKSLAWGITIIFFIVGLLLALMGGAVQGMTG
jgi:hypothetical protein